MAGTSQAKRNRLRPLPDHGRNFVVEWVPIESLKPNPANARTHSKKQIKWIARSIEEFGWLFPILVDKHGMVIAGHARREAARILGSSTVPIIRASHLSPEQVSAYALADNRLAQLAGWDREVLYSELKALADATFDITITGFDSIEIQDLFDDFSALAESEDEQVPVQRDQPPVAQRGDLFLLGKHRLLCGDATNPDDVRKLLGEAVPTVMVTDAPYGVRYDPAWRHRLGVNASKRSRGIANDDRADWRDAWMLFPGPVAYVWHSALHAATFQLSLEAAGFEVRAQIIWTKNRIVIGRGDFHWAHEPCWYAVRKGQGANWCGNRKQGTVWEIPNLISERDQATAHATQKPVECMRRPILNNSRPGDRIYDPFVGSGTTAIAAEATGRSAFCMEIDPQHVDSAVRRWQHFAGRDALHAETRKTFEEIDAERTKKPRTT
jgi:DNA modification methylase